MAELTALKTGPSPGHPPQAGPPPGVVRITPQLVEKLADLVYILLLRDLEHEHNRAGSRNKTPGRVV